MKVDVVDAAIRSRLFWSYGLMVHEIGEVIQEVVVWDEFGKGHARWVETIKLVL